MKLLALARVLISLFLVVLVVLIISEKAWIASLFPIWVASVDIICAEGIY
jgi:hypothetical protein